MVDRKGRTGVRKVTLNCKDWYLLRDFSAAFGKCAAYQLETLPAEEVELVHAGHFGMAKGEWSTPAKAISERAALELLMSVSRRVTGGVDARRRLLDTIATGGDTMAVLREILGSFEYGKGELVNRMITADMVVCWLDELESGEPLVQVAIRHKRTKGQISIYTRHSTCPPIIRAQLSERDRSRLR